MTSRELNMMLVNQLPIIKEEYKNEVSWQDGDDTGSHVVYGDVLVPYLKKVINEKNLNQQKKAFDFIENLLLMDDKYINEVIAFSVLESLLFDQEIDNSDFLRFANKKTIKIVDEIIENL